MLRKVALRQTVSLLAVCGLFALGFLYIGTTHRDRCMKNGNVACTILPWSGHPGGGEYGSGSGGNWWGP